MRFKSLYIKKHLSTQVTKWLFLKNNFKSYVFLKLFFKKYGATLHYPLNSFSRNYLTDSFDPRQFNLFKFSLFSRLLYDRILLFNNIFNINGNFFDLSFLNFYFFYKFLNFIVNTDEKNLMNRLKINNVQIANSFLLGEPKFFINFSSRILNLPFSNITGDISIFIKYFINKIFKILLIKYSLIYVCLYNTSKLFHNISCFFFVK